MNIHDVLPHLPEPGVLRARGRAMAMLDAIFTEDFRLHFHEEGPRGGHAMASMDNGSGDLYRVVFDTPGVFLYAFDHESPVSPWRTSPRAHWPGLLDGAELLADLIAPDPAAVYAEHIAQEYFERPTRPEEVAWAFTGEPPTPQRVAALNPERAWRDVVGDARDIGYSISWSAANETA
ncbi:hypothetical protein AB0I28_07830 [Phytomonospora sp. NPDC050363]|uniref:hypothetical protein n=1 Tax=Phytomonospora sp. NPDC050363 TaxID=3155642 RepID=UPI0033C5908D